MKKTIIITGTSSGIGKATALLFAQKGWNVIATMRQLADAGELADAENITVLPLDISDSTSIQSALEAAIDKFGAIDVLLNNAGFAQYGVFESLSEEQIRKQFEVNVFGTMKVTKAILPILRKQNQGMIVNVTSGSGRFAVPLMSLYNASKFALEGFSESLAYELASQNIIVKIIEPGATASNFHHTLEESTATNQTPESYHAYIAQLNAKMDIVRQQSAGASSQASDIAGTIYDAVTDGSTQLRYVSGSDIQPIIDLRTASSEAEYMAFMRNLFN